MWDSLISRGHGLASSLFSAIYPSTCPLCKNSADTFLYAPICTRCWESMARYSGPSCRVCATPLVSEYSTLCGECLFHPPPFSMVLNFGLYSGSLSEAIHLLKFSGLKRLAKPLGRLLTELPIPPMDGIVPVPVTNRTLRTRGFNQALLLSVVLSRHIRIPVYKDMLYKKRDTPAQIGLGAKERARNLKNAFEVRGRLHNPRLLLLDDVMTTGATVKECAKTLVKSGAQEVVAVTLARSMRD